MVGIMIGYSQKKQNVVSKVRERVRVDTIIVEQPDGTKITTIKELRDTERLTITESYRPNWNVGVSSTITDGIYGLRVERRIIGELYVGGYARTDSELGVSVSYSF